MADRCPDCTDITFCAKHAAEAPIVEIPEVDPLDEARRLIAEHEQQRLQACHAEIEAVLAKYGMRLQISQPTVVIVPNP